MSCRDRVGIGAAYGDWERERMKLGKSNEDFALLLLKHFIAKTQMCNTEPQMELAHLNVTNCTHGPSTINPCGLPMDSPLLSTTSTPQRTVVQVQGSKRRLLESNASAIATIPTCSFEETAKKCVEGEVVEVIDPLRLAGPDEQLLDQDLSTAAKTFEDGIHMSDTGVDSSSDVLKIDYSKTKIQLITPAISSIVQDELTLVNLKLLLELLKKCYGKSCSGCTEELVYDTTRYGTAVRVSWYCSGLDRDALRHSKGKWDSQPISNRVFAGNLKVASAIPLSGNLYGNVAMLMKHAKILFFDKDSYDYYQDYFICPAVREFWQKTQKDTMEELQGQSLVLAGDGINDSPGDTSKFYTYALADLKSHKILSTKTRNVSYATEKSTSREKLGFTLALSETLELGKKCSWAVQEIVTDDHIEIAAEFKKPSSLCSGIKHSLDIWNGPKNLLKRLIKLSEKPGLEAIFQWAPLIRNHFWYCSKNCEGDATMMKNLWVSQLHHVCNEHHWSIPNGLNSPLTCAHDEFTPEKILQHHWLDPKEAPFKAFKNEVMRPDLMEMLPYYSNFRHAGRFLDSHHNLIRMYAPKRQSFSYEEYQMRVQLAAIDHNFHEGRPQARDMDGNLRDRRYFSKRIQAWYMVPVLEPKEYQYIDALMMAIFERASIKGSMKRKRLDSEYHHKTIHPSRRIVDSPSKDVLSSSSC